MLTFLDQSAKLKKIPLVTLRSHGRESQRLEHGLSAGTRSREPLQEHQLHPVRGGHVHRQPNLLECAHDGRERGQAQGRGAKKHDLQLVLQVLIVRSRALRGRLALQGRALPLDPRDDGSDGVQGVHLELALPLFAVLALLRVRVCVC
jgi:hypothetical protein